MKLHFLTDEQGTEFSFIITRNTDNDYNLLLTCKHPKSPLIKTIDLKPLTFFTDIASSEITKRNHNFNEYVKWILSMGTYANENMLADCYEDNTWKDNASYLNTTKALNEALKLMEYRPHQVEISDCDISALELSSHLEQ